MVELTVDGTYTITDIRENKAVTVEGVEKTPNYYTVTLKDGTGYTLTVQDGSKSPVEESGSFGFTFALKKGYQKTKNFAVKVNGTAVELAADGTYVIENIAENKTVTVEGVKKRSSGGSSSGSDDSGDSSGGSDGGSGGGSAGETPPTPQNPPANTQQPANPDALPNPADDSTEAGNPADDTDTITDTKPAPSDDSQKTDEKTTADEGETKTKTTDEKTIDETSPADETTQPAAPETAPGQESGNTEAQDEPTQTVPVTVEDGEPVQSGKTHKCSLCHICPTFLGICYFIWLAILIVVIIIVLIIISRRKNDRRQKK